MPPKTPPKKKNGFHSLGTRIKQALTPVPKRATPELPYPRAILKAAEARAAYVAVYVIAPRQTGWPVSFGITSDPSALYWSFQKGYWEEFAIHELQWTAGRPAAERIKRAMTAMLASKKKGFWAAWHDVTVDEAKIALLSCARAEGVQLFDDTEKHRRLHRIALKAWEAKVGVETVALEAPQKASAQIIPMQRPPSTRKH